MHGFCSCFNNTFRTKHFCTSQPSRVFFFHKVIVWNFFISFFQDRKWNSRSHYEINLSSVWMILLQSIFDATVCVVPLWLQSYVCVKISTNWNFSRKLRFIYNKKESCVIIKYFFFLKEINFFVIVRRDIKLLFNEY